MTITGPPLVHDTTDPPSGSIEATLGKDRLPISAPSPVYTRFISIHIYIEGQGTFSSNIPGTVPCPTTVRPANTILTTGCPSP
jgi:hypothetical protein